MPDAVLDVLNELVPGGVARSGVRLGGRTVRWIEAGSGQPAVTLEAGCNDTAVTWAPVTAVLAGRARGGLRPRRARRQRPGAGRGHDRQIADLPQSSPAPRAGGACWPGTAGAETIVQTTHESRPLARRWAAADRSCCMRSTWMPKKNGQEPGACRAHGLTPGGAGRVRPDSRLPTGSWSGSPAAMAPARTRCAADRFRAARRVDVDPRQRGPAHRPAPREPDRFPGTRQVYRGSTGGQRQVHTASPSGGPGHPACKLQRLAVSDDRRHNPGDAASIHLATLPLAVITDRIRCPCTGSRSAIATFAPCLLGCPGTGR